MNMTVVFKKCAIYLSQMHIWYSILKVRDAVLQML